MVCVIRLYYNRYPPLLLDAAGVVAGGGGGGLHCLPVPRVAAGLQAHRHIVIPGAQPRLVRHAAPPCTGEMLNYCPKLSPKNELFENKRNMCG